MAKPYKAPPAEYFFELIDPATIRLKKFKDGEYTGQVYQLRGAINKPGHLQCDCPGAARGSGADHKHVQWIRRLEAIFRKNDWPLDNEHLVGVYFDSGKDMFYKNNDLDPSQLAEQLKELCHGG